MNKELLQQALDALIGVLDDAKDLRNASISGGLYEVIECRDAIAALREAIAQPVQPQRVPLTDEQIDAAWRSVDYKLKYEDFRISFKKSAMS